MYQPVSVYAGPTVYRIYKYSTVGPVYTQTGCI